LVSAPRVWLNIKHIIPSNLFSIKYAAASSANTEALSAWRRTNTIASASCLLACAWRLRSISSRTPLRVNYQPLRGTAEITEGLGAAKLTDTLSLRLHLAFLSSRAACTPTIKVKAFQANLLILRDYEGMGLFTGSAGLGWH